MQSILLWGADLIVAIQQFQTPWLTASFETFTWFGGHGYLYLVPFVVWCLGYRLGWQLLLLFVLTAFLNGLLKDWIALPRPYQMDTRILSDGEFGYSLPSGHAQLVVIYWGMLAAWLQRRWFWVVAVAIMFVMGLSRVYLGVHYPSDVLSGWLLGALLLWAWLRWAPSAIDWLGRQPQALRWRCLLVTTAALAAIGVLAGGEASTFAAVGMLLGAGAGMLVAYSALDFGPAALWQRALRYVLGMVVLLALLVGLQKLAALTAWPGPVEAFVLLIPLGLWLTVFPLLARALRLERPAPAQPPV